MYHNRNRVAELLSRPREYDDCGCDHHHHEHYHAPVIGIDSPVDGQLLQYSETLQAFINVNPDSITLTPQATIPTDVVNGSIFINNNQLCIKLNDHLYQIMLTQIG